VADDGKHVEITAQHIADLFGDRRMVFGQNDRRSSHARPQDG
jgi:hypothetical protein